MKIKDKQISYCNSLITEIIPLECGDLSKIWIDGISKKEREKAPDSIDMSFKDTICIKVRIKTEDDCVRDEYYNLYKGKKGYYSNIKQKKIYFDEKELRKIEVK